MPLFDEGSLTGLKGDTDKLIHYISNYLLEMRGANFSFETGDFLPVKRELLFSMIERVFNQEYSCLSSPLFLSYMKRGSANRIHHYSLTIDAKFEALEKSLIKLVFKRDKVNVQRYLERMVRADITKTVEALKRIALIDSEWFDLYLEFSSLGRWADKLDTITLKAMISYTASLVTSRHINVTSSQNLSSELKSIPVSEFIPMISKDLEIQKTQEGVKFFFYATALIESREAGIITEGFFKSKFENLILEWRFTKKTEITTPDFAFLMECIEKR